MRNIERTLTEHGLSSKETAIYLATLELGSGSILAISQHAHMPRSSTEVVLGRLQKQGLVSSFRRKRVKHFSAEDPRKLLHDAQQRTDRLKDIVPGLTNLFGTTKVRPVVRCYEGKAGVRVILNEILDEAKELITLSSTLDLYKTLTAEYPDFVKERVARKIPVKAISRDSPFARQRQKLGPQELREIRILQESIEYHGMIYVWNDKVAMFSLTKDLIGLIIESKELANAQRAMLQLIWNQLPPPPKF